jgi:hypothetical protein
VARRRKSWAHWTRSAGAALSACPAPIPSGSAYRTGASPVSPRI